MVESTSPVKPLEQGRDEKLGAYAQRLYDATLQGSNSIADAMRADPVNFALLINRLPDLIRVVKQSETVPANTITNSE